MTEDTALGRIYTIWMSDNSAAFIDPEDAPLVDRAMKVWIDSGRTRDTWLSIHQPGGAEFSVLASTITSSLVTEPSQRAAAQVRDKAVEDERAEHRRLAGFIESE